MNKSEREGKVSTNSLYRVADVANKLVIVYVEFLQNDSCENKIISTYCMWIKFQTFECLVCALLYADFFTGKSIYFLHKKVA